MYINRFCLDLNSSAMCYVQIQIHYVITGKEAGNNNNSTNIVIGLKFPKRRKIQKTNDEPVHE